MSLAIGDKQGTTARSDSAVAQLRLPLMTLLVAGIVGLVWLQYHHHIGDLRPLPAFAERLHQIQIPLLEFLGAMLCAAGGLALKNPAPSGRVASDNPKPRLSRTARRRYLAAYMLSFTLVYGAEFERFLWPHAGRTIAAIGFLVFVGLVLTGPFLANIRQKTRIPRTAYAGGLEREPLAVNTAALMLITAAAVFGLTFAAAKIARHDFPTHSETIIRIASLAGTGVVFFLWIFLQRVDPAAAQPAILEDAEGNETREAFRRKAWRAAWICLCVSLSLAALLSPLPRLAKIAIFRGEVPAFVVYALILRRIKTRIYRIGFRGQFDRAVRLNRLWSKLPFYGDSLEGSILFNAGRYREAQAFLKPLAFDAHGKPRLASVELYSYALALVNDNRAAEAEPLLEAAIPAARNPDYLKVALASCLLTQEKDPQRACRLLEEAMAVPLRGGPSKDNRADQTRRIARYAWALASGGRRQEAQQRIDESLLQAATLRPEDAAGVQYFVGEAWRVMGENAKARAAYSEAVRLRPTGVTALSVQKALAKMGTR
jgi:tetratricopeptide (TPR) repeat protein